MKFVRQLNKDDLQYLQKAVASYEKSDTQSRLIRLLNEACRIREFNDRFCTHLRSLTTRVRILKKINNLQEESVLMGEAAGTYYDKLKKNEIFTDKELLLVSLIENYFSEKKILEIGCGVGQVSIYLKMQNIDIEACDFTPHRESLTKNMCEHFNINLPFYNIPFQELDLKKYDMIIAANVRSPRNNFLHDKTLFESFLTDKNKFVILDWTDYSTTEQDKGPLQTFSNDQINRILNYIETRGAQKETYAAL
jgi:2-polyprenyl-3-methyl-5-hydroxy-6-metoxy-1,4-benzoquinol methylase